MYGLFEPLVMQFGMTNAPADIQPYINIIIRKALDNYASVHLEDILIYSMLIEELPEHVTWVLKRHLEGLLYLKPEKSELHQETVKYIRLNITTKGISMDQNTVDTAKNWSRENTTPHEPLHNLFKVQQVLGFSSNYKGFLKGYTGVSDQLTRLM
jgi:hypothetical protein